MNVKKMSLVLMIVMYSICGCEKVEDEATKSYDSSEMLYEIDFPEYGGDIATDITYVDNIKKVENSHIINKAYIIDKEGNEKIANNIKKKFGLKEEQVLEQNDGVDTKEYMRIYDNGYITYKSRKLDDVAMEDLKEVKLTKEELEKISDEFLKEIGLMDEGKYEIMTYGEDRIENLSTGKEIVVSKIINYKKSIDGVDINAPFAASIQIDADGEIIRCDIPNLIIKEEIEIDKQNIIDSKNAIESAKNCGGMISIDERANKVAFNKMKVELWADAYPITISEHYIIQPVYKVEGKSYLGENELGEALFFENAIKVEE